MAVEDYSRNGLKGLPGLNMRREPTNMDFLRMAGITPSGRELNAQNRPLMDEPVGIELGRLGVGESTYDQDIQTMSEAQNIGNFRGENQSGLVQVGNGLLKMTTTALTTLADGTIGTLWGLGQGIVNLADDDEKTGFWQGMWNNDFNKAMSNIQEDMEKIAPNYYTDEQLNSPWYSAANVLSANFLGDKLLKNAGFTIGALAALAVPGFDMAWLAKGVSAGAKFLGMSSKAASNTGAIANYLARTFMSANSEASIEAINAVKDNQKSMYEGIEQRAREDAAASEQIMAQEILNGVDEQTAQSNHMNRLRTIDQEVKNAKAYADDQLRDVGNSVWLMNVGLLSLTNSIEFGNILKGGYNLRKSLKDFGVKLTAEGKEVGVREFGQAMAKGLKTSITPAMSKVSAAGVAAGTAKRFAAEGFEEGAQRIISDSNEMQAQAKLQEWATDRYNKDSDKYSLWEKQINPSVTADLVDYTKALGNAWKEGFGSFSSSGWEEVFLGGLTGMFGTAGLRRKADGKMGIGWQGGFMESIRDQQAKYTEADRMIQQFNDQVSKDEFKNRMQWAAAKLAAAYDMEEALNNGDIMGYKNGEMLSVANDAIYFRDNGMLDFFKGYYEETAKNVSDETINNLRAQTKDVNTGKSFYDSKSDDEIRQMIQDKSKSTLEKIENTVSIYEDMERQYTDKFRGVDVTPYLEDVKDPVVKAMMLAMPSDYAQKGIQQLTYLSTLHDDLVRRRGELEQERDAAEGSIDGADKVKKINKDILEIDNALSDIKDRFNKAKNHPEELVEEMIDAQVVSAKEAIGREAQATKQRYFQAKTLQDVADTFYYGNFNQSVLEEAIQEAADEDNKNLLNSFYPFSVEVNATEGAIDKVVNESTRDEDDEVKNRAKAALGSFAQQAIEETLGEQRDSGVSSTVADKLREYGETIVANANQDNQMDVLGAESTAAFLEEVAHELDKVRAAAKVPEVKPVEEPKKKTEEKQEDAPEAGKKGEPQDAAAQPETPVKPEVTSPKKSETPEAEIKPVEASATPATSAKKVGDKVTLTDGFTGTIKSIPKAGVYEITLENGKTGIYTDENIVEPQAQAAPQETIPQSPTGGNEQNTQVTPNREEEQGAEQGTTTTPTETSQATLTEAQIETPTAQTETPINNPAEVPAQAQPEQPQAQQEQPKEVNPLEVLLAWARGEMPYEEAVRLLKGTKYVKTIPGKREIPAIGQKATKDTDYLTPAREITLGKYLTDTYPFLTTEWVKQATTMSTMGGDANLYVVKDAEGNEYGTPSGFIRSLATKPDGMAAEAIRRGEASEQNKEEQAGTSAQDTRVIQPDTEEQEEKKEEIRSGKSFTGTAFLTYSQTILGRRNAKDKGVAIRRKGPSLEAFQALLAANNIDIDHVVNNYIYEFMEDGKLPVRYMVMKDSENKVTPKEGHEHIFLVTKITDKIQKLIDKDTKLQGNVKKMSNGEDMLIVGVLGYGTNDTDLIQGAERIREAYRNMDDASKAGTYTLIPSAENSIFAMNGGQMVLQFEGQEKGNTDLKTLLDSQDSLVNPRQLKIGDIRFATALGKEGSVKLRFFQKREGDDQYGFLDPLSLQSAPGNVWMFIRSADGRFIPTAIEPTTWNDANMNWDSTLGTKIKELVDNLATVTDKESIPALLKELNQRLIFSVNDRNRGNRIFYDEKTGELSFRRFNLDAASDNAKIIMDDKDSDFLVVDRSESLIINLHNPNRSMDESREILNKMIEALDPVINIQNSVMSSQGGIKMYLDAGLFKVAIKSLGMVNAKTYVYPVNSHLEPINSFVVAPIAMNTTTGVNTFYYNGERFIISDNIIYDSSFKEVTDRDTIDDIRAAADIQSGKVRPVRTNDTKYWEINGKVYSQYRNGGYARLSPTEEVEYKQRKAAEAEKKAREKAAKEEADRLEKQKSTQAKYSVGQNLNGREITEVNIVDNEVIYTFNDAQNGIKNGTISQTELDSLLSEEAKRAAETPQQEAPQSETDSNKEVKKTEQDSETLAKKVRKSRNNSTFVSLFKGSDGRSLLNNLISAINNALDKAGEDSKQFKGTKSVEEELLARGKNIPTSISELQALIDELNSCGF